MAKNRLVTPVSEEDHSQGTTNAVLTLVEYGDYQCPYCGMAQPVVKRLQRHFGKDLRFIFRNFPLTQSHAHALAAAAAAESAGLQGKFWEMHDMLYEHQDQLQNRDLLEYANALGLELNKFNKDMTSEEIITRVRADFMSGEMSGVDGTPSFYVNEIKYVGPSQFEDMRVFIDSFRERSEMIF